MSLANRRHIVLAGLAAAVAAAHSRAFGVPLAGPAPAPVVCLMKSSEIAVESNESPFFEHFHALAIPLTALLDPPANGIVVRSSQVDQGSYDIDAFKRFISASGLDPKTLIVHDHDVAITHAQLLSIGSGEKDVELRVISAKGNYVHNFLVTAPAIYAR